MRSGDPSHANHQWTAHGLGWSRFRHSFYSPDYSQTSEVIMTHRGGAHGWKLMVVREGWWADNGTDPIKNPQWTHLVAGQRIHALKFLKDIFEEDLSIVGSDA